MGLAARSLSPPLGPLELSDSQNCACEGTTTLFCSPLSNAALVPLVTSPLDVTYTGTRPEAHGSHAAFEPRP